MPTKKTKRKTKTPEGWHVTIDGPGFYIVRYADGLQLAHVMAHSSQYPGFTYAQAVRISAINELMDVAQAVLDDRPKTTIHRLARKAIDKAEGAK